MTTFRLFFLATSIACLSRERLEDMVVTINLPLVLAISSSKTSSSRASGGVKPGTSARKQSESIHKTPCLPIERINL